MTRVRDGKKLKGTGCGIYDGDRKVRESLERGNRDKWQTTQDAIILGAGTRNSVGAGPLSQAGRKR